MMTTGSVWPCNEGRAPRGDVVVLNAEDAAEDTIIPRLIAAGADLRRVHLVNAVREVGRGNRTFSLLTDLDLLAQEIDRINRSSSVVLVKTGDGRARASKGALKVVEIEARACRFSSY